MAALIQRIAAQSLRAFATTDSITNFREHMRSLVALVNQITSRDVNLNSRVVSNSEVYSPGSGIAPIVYIPLWEDTVFSMGIFVVRKGAKIPLHDHPGMHGIIKVIHGEICLKSFSRLPEGTLTGNIGELRLKPWQRSRIFPAKLEQHCTTTSQSEACVLSPHEANFHELTSVNGAAAFLDILAPPYDHDTGMRQCHYYRELTDEELVKQNGASNPVNILMKISQPRDFFGDHAEYEGPEINPYSQNAAVQ